MRKVLIPTDFTIESLQLIEYAILNFPDKKLDIILIAGHKLPDTRWDLTRFRTRTQVRKQLNEKFNASIHRINMEHKKNIERISFELFTGINSYAFRNFLEQLDAHDAVVPKQKTLYCEDRKWFDTTKFIKKNVKNIIEAPMECTEEVPQRKFSILSLFS
ncbi:hypothetical protein [Sediminicola luteus]|uniref:UspA domain-containing protein n=1 Tax=Sediminicola luteus TaxID=319238 RepID=A0ABV2TSV1_9FLAO